MMDDIHDWGGPLMQPCGKAHFTCDECGRIRLQQIIEQAKKADPHVPLRLVEDAFKAISSYHEICVDGTCDQMDLAFDKMEAAIRAAREGAR